MGSDYDEVVWETIKNRKQYSDEPVVIFVSVLEQLFSRLSSTPAVVTKIKWIQKHLRPEFVERLALNKFNSVEELLRDVKSLAKVFCDLQSRGNRSKVNVLESNVDLGFNYCSSVEGHSQNKFSKK